MSDAWFDSADYELVWPRVLFARELAALRASAPVPGPLRGYTEFHERIEFLLEAAFLGQTPAAEFRRAAAIAPIQDDPGARRPRPPRSWPAPTRSLISSSIVCRCCANTTGPSPTGPTVTAEPATSPTHDPHCGTASPQLIGEMRGQGMFGRDLPLECVDDDDPVREIDVLAARLGLPGLWPLQSWLVAAGLTEGPVLRPVSKGNRPLPRRLHPESVNDLVQAAVARAGIDPTGYSAHFLHAGFVTYAHRRGASDRAIAYQTRHRSLATVGTYVRIHEAWADNAATMLGLSAASSIASSLRGLRPRPRAHPTPASEPLPTW